MPIFMDRHDVPGVNAKDVAKAHQADLKIQDEFNCKALTYWFDEDRGMAFCLIEAPDKKSVQDLHDHAHGLIPNQVIEVEPRIVESFLGRIEDPVGSHEPDAVIDDPAFRVIMAFYLNPVYQITDDLPETDRNYQETFKAKFKEFLTKHNGLSVEYTNECFISSFVSAKDAILCASAINDYASKKSDEWTNGLIQLKIGVSAGVPIANDTTFFGPTVKLARYLGLIAKPGNIMVSSTVNDLWNSQSFSSEITEPLTITTLTPQDEDFLHQLLDIIDKHACNPDFDTNEFGKLAGMSKSQLYRKTTALTGYSPNDFIREYRLGKALRLIEKQNGNISEIAFESGFNSLSYFSKCFQRRFGIVPSSATSIKLQS